MGRGRAFVGALAAAVAVLAPATARAAPANDAFASAQALAGTSGSANGSNGGATKESGEPNHAGNRGGASVWFSWTAPASGPVIFDTAGSAPDTLLAAYSGTNLPSLVFLAGNDDVSSSDKTSRISFTATAGTAYSIAVDGWRGATGTASQGPLALHWTLASSGGGGVGSTRPPNDAFAAAAALSGATGTIRGTTIQATKEPGEPAHAGSGGASIWYAWTAPASGTETLTTAGSGFDTVLAAYTGSSVGALTAIASNDDASGSTSTSAISFTAAAGTTYRIAVDGYRHRSTRVVETGAAVLNWSGQAAFTPPPAPAAHDPAMLAAGDIASCTSNGDEQTAQLLARNQPDAIATLGDTVYENATPADFANCFAPSWGPYKAKLWPAAGNHEYKTGSAAGYFGYFGTVAGDPRQGWYSYDLGTWHVIVLNSDCSFVGGCGPGSPQETWLRADLAAHPARCTLAYWHHPLFSSGFVGDDAEVAPFWQALQDYGADLVLNGHAHMYERFAKQTLGGIRSSSGIRELVVGTGGAELVGFGAGMAPNSEVANIVTWGILELTLHPGSYEWRFLPVAGSSFVDSGSDVCH